MSSSYIFFHMTFSRTLRGEDSNNLVFLNSLSDFVVFPVKDLAVWSKPIVLGNAQAEGYVHQSLALIEHPFNHGMKPVHLYVSQDFLPLPFISRHIIGKDFLLQCLQPPISHSAICFPYLFPASLNSLSVVFFGSLRLHFHQVFEQSLMKPRISPLIDCTLCSSENGTSYAFNLVSFRILQPGSAYPHWNTAFLLHLEQNYFSFHTKGLYFRPTGKVEAL